MHSTCLYCTKDLGANEILETLPIGRRIAFDAATGRLWVVCRHCAKWNLVPFDNRLETIDAAERLFRDTPTRYSTEHIGLAKVREGLELVRIGGAERREFAAWRYGRNVKRRRQRATLVVGGGASLFVALSISTHLNDPTLTKALIGVGGAVANTVGVVNAIAHRLKRLRLRHPETGESLTLKGRHIDAAALTFSDDGTAGLLLARQEQHITLSRRTLLTTEHRGPTFEYGGAEARRMAGRVLPKANLFLGGREQVDAAAGLIDERSAWSEVVAKAVRSVVGMPLHRDHQAIVPISALSPELRLALEMAAHEDSERQWLAGELALLEREWREADRLAKISDGLVLGDVELPKT